MKKISRLPYRDPFGYPLWAKRMVIFWFGTVTWYRLNRIHRTHVEGMEHLADLPDENVLFVSNHQTYFMDVASLFLAFMHHRNGMPNRVDRWWPVVNPRMNLFFVAAKETMKSGLLPRLLALGGSVSIKRTWREAGKEINRGVDPKDLDNIRKAIKVGWVITFPQGTTKPFAPGRRGTAHIIRDLQPIVVPVVIDGFRRGFDKKGLRVKKRRVDLKIRFKEPLHVAPEASPQQILDQVMVAIEQVRHDGPQIPT